MGGTERERKTLAWSYSIACMVEAEGGKRSRMMQTLQYCDGSSAFYIHTMLLKFCGYFPV